MSTDVNALQELTALESAAAQEKNLLCCMTWTVPGCHTSFVST